MNAAHLCQNAVEEGQWQQATNRYALTQAAVNIHSNFVDFYNILKFRVFGGSESEGNLKYDAAMHAGMPGMACQTEVK